MIFAQTPLFATPLEEITRSVAVAGQPDVASATQKQFLKAFTAVALRVSPRDLPDYVIAAINLRPEFAPNIVGVAIKAGTKQRHATAAGLCTLVERIIAAAIAANPEAAVSIAKAGSAAAPELRHCVVSAGVLAAPGQKEAIVHAATARAIPFAFLTFSANETSGFSFSAATLSPANISDLGDDDSVTSPEQPPTP